MKQKLSYIFTILAIGASLVFPAAAAAQISSNDSSESDEVSSIETDNHSMSDRISRFKTTFKVKLSLAEAAHIKLKCVGAQGVVGQLNSRFGNSVTVRTQAYTELQKNLDKLVTKLKAKNVNTTTLEQQITELKAKITTYSTDLAAYKQSLADLKAVDCKTDPTGFQAALLAARTAHETLVSDVLAIRTYLVNTIKPTLQSIRQELEKDSQSDTNSEESN